jgi:hypothetical protein
MQHAETVARLLNQIERDERDRARSSDAASEGVGDDDKRGAAARRR